MMSDFNVGNEEDLGGRRVREVHQLDQEPKMFDNEIQMIM